MAEFEKLEPHDLCPGGSGKIIRDCGCAPLLPKINEVCRGFAGGQRRAAIDQLGALTKKEGPRPCLGTLLARFQYISGDVTGAIETAQQMVEANPEMPAPLALLAEFLAGADDDRARDVLLDACERYEDTEADLQFLISAILQNGARLLERYDVLGAFPWLRIAYEFLDEETQNEVANLMIGDHDTKNVSIFANLSVRRLVTPKGADGPPELKPFGEAMQASIRGRFRKAAELLQNAVAQHPERVDAWKELVLAYAAMGKAAEAVQALKEMAQQEGLSPGWKLWIHSVAQWHESVAVAPPVFRQELRWEVVDASQALELLHADSRALILPNIREIAADMSPPPKAAFAMLTQPPLKVESAEEAANVDPARVPVLKGIALLFGKQTDQPAMLQIVVDHEDADPIAEQIESALGDQLKNRQQADSRRQVPACLRHEVHWELSGAPPESVADLVQKCDQYWLESVWTEMPHVGLNGQTPKAVAGQAEWADALAAAVFNVEAAMMAVGKVIDFDAVRRQLDVPVLATIDPWETPVDGLALPEWTRVDMVKLGQDDAMKLFTSGVGLRYVGIVRKMGEFLLDLLGPEDAKLKAGILHQLAETEFDLRRSAEYLAQAAELLEQANEDSFGFRYLSLERTFRTGAAELLEPRMRAAFQAAERNPQYLQALIAMLEQFGFSLQPGPGQRAAGTAPPAAGSGLWTPDGGTPAAPNEEPKQESKLWIPGTD